MAATWPSVSTAATSLSSRFICPAAPARNGSMRHAIQFSAIAPANCNTRSAIPRCAIPATGGPSSRTSLIVRGRARCIRCCRIRRRRSPSSSCVQPEEIDGSLECSGLFLDPRPVILAGTGRHHYLFRDPFHIEHPHYHGPPLDAMRRPPAVVASWRANVGIQARHATQRARHPVTASLAKARW